MVQIRKRAWLVLRNCASKWSAWLNRADAVSSKANRVVSKVKGNKGKANNKVVSNRLRVKASKARDNKAKVNKAKGARCPLGVRAEHLIIACEIVLQACHNLR